MVIFFIFWSMFQKTNCVRNKIFARCEFNLFQERVGRWHDQQKYPSIAYFPFDTNRAFYFFRKCRTGGCWCEHQSQLIILQGWIFYTFKPKKNQYFSKKLVVRKKICCNFILFSRVEIVLWMSGEASVCIPALFFISFLYIKGRFFKNSSSLLFLVIQYTKVGYFSAFWTMFQKTSCVRNKINVFLSYFKSFLVVYFMLLNQYFYKK